MTPLPREMVVWMLALMTPPLPALVVQRGRAATHLREGGGEGVQVWLWVRVCPHLAFFADFQHNCT